MIIINEEELVPTLNHDSRLPDIEIISNGTPEHCKLLVDGVDYTKEKMIKSIKVNMEVNELHTVTVEFYVDNIRIKTNARVEKKCVQE